MKVKGFTLIELIVTLLIGSLLLAWGVPNYRDFKLRRVMVDNTNDIVYSLNLARAEAIRYGTDVRVVPTGGDWQQGWTVTAAGVGGSGDTIIEEHDPVSNIVFQLIGSPSNTVVFNRIGGLIGFSEVRFNLTHSQDSTMTRAIRIRLSGTAKVIES